MYTKYSKAFFAVIKFYGTPLNLSSLTLIKCRILPPPTVKKLINSDSFICWFLITHSHNFHNNCGKVEYGLYFPDFREIHKQKIIFSQLVLCQILLKYKKKILWTKFYFCFYLNRSFIAPIFTKPTSPFNFVTKIWRK